MPKNISVLTRTTTVPDDASKMSEAQLLSTLKWCGIGVTRKKLERIFDRTLSINQLVEFLIRRYGESGQGYVDLNFVTEALFELSHRWFSAKVSFDRLHDKMDDSYDGDIGSKRGLDSWLAVWKEALQLQEVTSIRTVREFDNNFPGIYSLQKWFDIFDKNLGNAGISDPQYYRLRISVSEEAIKRFGVGGAQELDRFTDRRRTGIAASYFNLGERDKTDELYRKWLKTNPRWGTGWCGWAQNYSLAEPPIFDKAEQILKEGLAVDGVTQKNVLIEGLIQVYEKQERHQEADLLLDQYDFNDDTDYDCEDLDDFADDRALLEFWDDETLLNAMSELILTPK